MIRAAMKRWVLGAAALWAGSCLASAQTWNLTGGGNWNLDGNWSAAPFPNAPGATALLGNKITANSNVVLGQNITVGSLLIDDNNNYTLRNPTGQSNLLIFDAGLGAAALTVTNLNGNGAHTIQNVIRLDSDLVVTQGSAGTLTLFSSRTGAGGLTKEGTGTVTLSGTSTYLGATAINNGTVNYNTAGALPAGAVSVGNGVGAADSAILNLNASMGVANALSLSIASDGLVLQANNRLVRLNSATGTGEIRLNAAVGNGFEFLGAGAGNDSTFSGQITGGMVVVGAPNPAAGSRINKTGTATLTLDGANSYVARTFISGGAIRAANSTALGSNAADSGTYVYSAGSLEISGSTTLSEVIALNGLGSGGNGALRSVSGTNTVSGPVALGWAGGSVTESATSIGVDAGSQLTVSGNITGAQNLTKVGAGTLVFTGNNSYSGTTTVGAGTLELSSSATAIAGTSITVNTGGTLLLSGSDQISNSTNLTLAGGAFSLGTGFSDELGTLTLTSDSSISLGASIHNLRFGASNLAVWTPGTMLTILGWTGLPDTGGTAGRIFFGADDLALTSAQLSQITFNGYSGAKLLSSGELVPVAVPEAEADLAASLLALLVAWKERHRVAQWVRQAAA